MPPPNRVQISQNEGSIMLAMSAFNSGQCDSISAAAKAYNLQRFIKRTPALETRLGRTYKYQRKLYKDPVVIESWFRLVKNIVDKYSILLEDTYNFDKTSFQIGQINTSIVVTAIDRQGRLKQVKLTNTT
ncbi:MAG: hypothetical protein FE78DRAFT_89105 [Acidomyces sp. 'richmondensis']|nr:MAG: hypothetical protein FE78DRAFT_89105 [Acidomyces sp. 'richmondensis']